MNTLYLRFFQVRREVYQKKGDNKEQLLLKEVKYWQELSVSDKGGENLQGILDAELKKIILHCLSEIKVQHTFSYGDKEHKGKTEEKNFKGSGAFRPNETIEGDLILDICFIDISALRDPNIFLSMVEEKEENEKVSTDEIPKQKVQRLITNPRTRKFDREDYKPNPILYIGVDNLMELGHVDAKNQEESEKAERKLLDALHQQIDPRFRYLDSSIWNQYLSVVPAPDFAKRLQAIVKNILRYHIYGLYRSVIAQEYLEFQTRKLIQSYVKDYPGGHSKDVTPFRFHSESKMREKAENKRENLQGYSWNCQLIDDYALKPLRPMKNEEDKVITNKKELVLDLVNTPDLGSGIKEENTSLINIQSPLAPASSEIPQTKGFINSQYKLLTQDPRPDIMILDYFLGSEEKELDQKYGHKFIRKLTEELDKDFDSKKESLALGKYWIFPISGFEHAFRSHQRLMGLSAGNEYIDIGDGADPINSPQLFRYLFYSFLDYQRKTALPELHSLLTTILTALRKDSLKEVIKENYAQIVQTIALAKVILKERGQSELAQSFFTGINAPKFDQDFLLHIQGFISLIAHGSSWDWKRMWDEYLFIMDTKSTFGLPKVDPIREPEPDWEEKRVSELLETLFEKTDEYILNLKNQIQ